MTLRESARVVIFWHRGILRQGTLRRHAAEKDFFAEKGGESLATGNPDEKGEGDEKKRKGLKEKGRRVSSSSMSIAQTEGKGAIFRADPSRKYERMSSAVASVVEGGFRNSVNRGGLGQHPRGGGMSSYQKAKRKVYVP